MLAAGLALAADVTGKWTGEVAGPDGGGMSIALNLKQDGSKLTGSVEAPGGQVMEIQDGKIDGDKISFAVSFDGGGGAMKVAHEGTVAGDEITLHIKMEGGQEGGHGGPIKLKRAK